MNAFFIGFEHVEVNHINQRIYTFVNAHKEDKILFQVIKIP